MIALKLGPSTRDRWVSARSIDMSPTAGLTGVEGTAPYVARNPAAIGLTETAALDDESRPSGAEGGVRRPELRRAAGPGGRPTV